MRFGPGELGPKVPPTGRSHNGSPATWRVASRGRLVRNETEKNKARAPYPFVALSTDNLPFEVQSPMQATCGHLMLPTGHSRPRYGSMTPELCRRHTQTQELGADFGHFMVQIPATLWFKGQPCLGSPRRWPRRPSSPSRAVGRARSRTGTTRSASTSRSPGPLTEISPAPSAA